MPTARPLQICIATGDIAGPIRNGGIGTFYRALAQRLADAGHRVTVLFILGDFCENQTIDYWRNDFANRNIEFVPLPALCPFTRPHTQARASLDVYHWLRDRHFDLVHFPEWRGHGFYSLLARKQGLAFANTLFAVGTHSPTAWHRDGMGLFLTDIEDLQTDHMERTSVALADRLISPSRYMLRWMEDHGWKLPESIECIQYIQATYRPAGDPVEPVARPVNELVFFGRLETRKGLTVFCDAVDKLDAAMSLSVTFLGKLTTVDGKPSRSYIQSRTAKWKFPVSIEDTLDHAGALEYLGQSGRLAVICSLLENSPNTVMECLSNDIPLLATDVGGIPELIDPRDRSRTLFPARAGALAERLAEAIRVGQAPSRPTVEPEVTHRLWLEWHEQIARDLYGTGELGAGECKSTRGHPLIPSGCTQGEGWVGVDGDGVGRGSDRAEPLAKNPHLSPPPEYKGRRKGPLSGQSGTLAERADGPFISVILVTHDRPVLLEQAIDSLRAQTFGAFEVILVDDGSAAPAAIEHIDSLREEFDRRGWKIVRQRNLYLGAARNSGAAVSRGTWILFMDDDNVAKPDELATFATAARSGSADIFTCLLDFFSGDKAPGGDVGILHRWLPIGGATAAGAFVNSFGDSNALIRRDVFLALGGFTDDHGVGFEDWELYAKASLAGYVIQVIPEALFWYRVSADSMSRTTGRYANHMRSLRPYLAHAGPDLAGALELAVGMFAAAQTPPVPAPSPTASGAAGSTPPAPVPANGDPDAYQRLVDAYWDSPSWRISAPLRNAIMRLRGQQPAPRPVVSSRYSADIIIGDIRSSISWEMTGPLRAMSRLVDALRRK